MGKEGKERKRKRKRELMREDKESLGNRKKIEGKKGAEPKSVSPPTHPYHF